MQEEAALREWRSIVALNRDDIVRLKGDITCSRGRSDRHS
jgi:predicted phosphohydrolase